MVRQPKVNNIVIHQNKSPRQIIHQSYKIKHSQNSLQKLTCITHALNFQNLGYL